MNAVPRQPTSPPTILRPPLGGVVVAAAFVLSIWLLVAAGVQRSGTRDGTVPAPLPEVPSAIGAELRASKVEVGPAPLPGPAIVPIEGSLSPR